MRIAILAAIGLYAGAVSAAPRWQWEDAFSNAEQGALIDWIEATDRGMTRLFGTLPYDYTVHFYRSRGGEPVPWAETNKSGGRHALFHVNPAYPRAVFLADWTAPHELSHLMFPYLGGDGRWFAEGVASYLQYQIMYASGALEWPRAMERYTERFASAAADGALGQASIIEQSRSGRPGHYVRLYWGGAAYFLEVDRRLSAQKGERLADVIGRYMACCFKPWGVDDQALIATLDAVSGSRIFSEVQALTVANPGFPDTRAALRWLRENPPPLRDE